MDTSSEPVQVPVGSNSPQPVAPVPPPNAEKAPGAPVAPVTVAAPVAPAVARPARSNLILSFRLKLAIFLLAGITIVSSAAVTVVLARSAITSWDVLAAANSVADLKSDIASIRTEAKATETAATLPDLSKASSDLERDTADALKQYDILKVSPVLKDKKVIQQFTGLKSKWTAYATFVQGTSADNRTLGPLLEQLNSSQQTALNTNRQSASSLATQLIQYKSLIDAIGQQSANLKMKTAPDQKLLGNLNQYVTSTDKAITQTQTDISAKKPDANALSVDVAAIATAAAVFSNAQDEWASTSLLNLQQVDPSSALDALNSALGNLSKRVSQS